MKAISKGINIYADIREPSSIISFLEKNCTVKKKQLKSADYLLSKDVAVERKTTSDFIQSIIDKRIFQQLERMKSFSSPILIIEGPHILSNDRNIHPNALRGAVASITVNFSVPIIWTRNEKETAEMLLMIAKREQEENGKSNSLRGKKKFLSKNQQQIFLISGLPKISNVTASRLLKHFKTPASIFAATEEELQKVEGIGNQMAKNIHSILHRKYEKSILED